jgi:hypothetical protein
LQCLAQSGDDNAFRPDPARRAGDRLITIDDPTGVSGYAVVPGSVMNDRFSVEV